MTFSPLIGLVFLRDTVVVHHPGSLCSSFVAVMAFTASAAIMGYQSGIITSPGSAPVFALSPQSSLPVTSL